MKASGQGSYRGHADYDDFANNVVTSNTIAKSVRDGYVEWSFHCLSQPQFAVGCFVGGVVSDVVF